MTLQNNNMYLMSIFEKWRLFLQYHRPRRLTVVIVIMNARIITVGMNVKSFGRKMCELRKITATISILLVIVSH